ncbi:MAG: sodium:calcium symporter [Akkermansiaceae bacterium]|nr:sodium:calcium symporter [Akkermansiaceae bacterium]
MSSNVKSENWSSNLGVVLAVAGSAIGFGNFLRFPGLAAQYGGGAFMIAYFCAFLLMGIPLSWVEWSIGRKGGRLNGHSAASIFYLISRSRYWKYLGLAGVVIPLCIAMYYIALEGWTLGYAWHTAMGDLDFNNSKEYGEFFSDFTGAQQDGAVFFSGESTLLLFFGVALLANFYLLYKGVSKGIEWFSKISMPILLITAIIVLIRVLTMGTPNDAYPDRNVSQGLGYMWNPDKVILVDTTTINENTNEAQVLDMVPAGAGPAEQASQITRLQEQYPQAKIERREISLWEGLCNPELWIAAAGQIFYSLSIGYGIVCTYASYVKRGNDIALGSLTANAANEVAEVGLAGMMIIPAAVSLLGVAAAAGAGTFGLGFNVLPQVFNSMPGGAFFGTLFFVLLSIGAITSAISILQPAVAYVEEFWSLRRVQSVCLVALMLAVGTLIVIWYTGNGLLALDTLDFWVGTMSLYISSALFLFMFRNVWGTANGLAELRSGAAIPIGRNIAILINWVTPCIMIIIFGSWVFQNLFVKQSRHITNIIEGKAGAIFPLVWVVLVTLFFCFIARTSRRFKHGENLETKYDREPFS